MVFKSRFQGKKWWEELPDYLKPLNKSFVKFLGRGEVYLTPSPSRCPYRFLGIDPFDKPVGFDVVEEIALALTDCYRYRTYGEVVNAVDSFPPQLYNFDPECRYRLIADFEVYLPYAFCDRQAVKARETVLSEMEKLIKFGVPLIWHEVVSTKLYYCRMLVWSERCG